MILKGGEVFEKEDLSPVRPFYPCIHSGDIYCSGTADMADCRIGGYSYHYSGVYIASYVKKGRYKIESCNNETSEISCGYNESTI